MEQPEFLGPYRLGVLLGRGGMGSVYEGVHVKSGQHVAIKLIAENVSDDMRFRRRFEEEYNGLKRLRHKNIVQLIGHGEQAGQLFYSMELVQGDSLQHRIRTEKRLNWMTAIDIAIQVCSALKHAHDIGVIHRDLKPANLILTGNNQVKLVDFGIAKIFGSAGQTMVGSVLGTADYMAPEQVTSEGITTRTDLYALGSVMYAMLAGRPPFKGKSVTQVIESLTREKPIPLDMVNPEVPEALVEMIHQLLEKDPQDRPPTALAVMNRLKSMRAGLQRGLTVDRQGGETQVRRGGEGFTAAIEDHLAKPSAQTRHQPGMSPDDVTVADPAAGVTQQRADDFEIDTQASESPRTHFQTVDTAPAGSTLLGSAEPQVTNGLARGLSIALLVVALVAGSLLVVKSLQGPSAEELYGQIISTRDASELSDAKADIDRFLKLYPADKRAEEVRGMRDSLELAAVLRRLRLQEKLDVTPLEEQEKALLAAMDLRETDSALAQQKLRQWLDVFVDSTIHADDERRRLGELVEFELANLSSQGPVKSNEARIQELLARVKKSEHLPLAERRSLLDGLIKLYADQSWAQPAVQEAQRRLDDIDSFAEDNQ
jgi:serine/threonine-protein kinase